MKLSKEASEALERVRKHDRKIYTDAHERWEAEQIAIADREILADEMLSLFPVRTLNGLTTRWDDAITPERLVASGFTQHPHSPRVLVCPPGAGDTLGYLPVNAAWCLPGDDHPMPDERSPTNMGEVWDLMAKCGCEVGK